MEMPHRDVMELLQQKTNLRLMCMQLQHIMGTHSDQKDTAL
jgi:hypothetical protein